MGILKIFGKIRILSKEEIFWLGWALAMAGLIYFAN